MVARAAVIAAGVAVVLFTWVGPASAHPTLLFTTPAADTAEAVSPTAVVLVFNELVTVGPGGIVVLDRSGRPVPVGAVTTGRESRAVTGRLAASLPTGVYTVRWRVTGSDGDLVESSFRFAVGAAIGQPDQPGGGLGVSWPSAGLRWLLFAGLAVALGGLAGERITASARDVNPKLPAIASWVAPGAFAGFGAVVGLSTMLVADSGGGDVGVLLRVTAGQVLVVEALGFAAGLVLAGLRRTGLAAFALLLVPLAEGMRSHGNVAEPGWGALLTAVHLAAAAVWVGALVHAVRAGLAWRAQRAAVWWVVAGYARLAVWLFVTVVVTGTLTALLLVSPSAVLSTPYGRLLLVKLALVAAAAGFAVAARWWLRRGLERAASAVRAARIEAGVLTVVLAVTAVLVSTPPARGPQAAQLAAAPRPEGVVLPLGTLAGQVGVGIAASDRQLVVRLATPRRGDYYTPAERQEYTLSGRVVPAGQTEQRVRFRGCGEGCYVATVNWADGDNLLTLRAGAPGWRGGSVGVVVPWPVQPAANELSRAVAAMRRTGDFTLYEVVTSDTSKELPAPQPLPLTGPAFLATEPYSSGVAPQVVQIPAGAGYVRLALGFPAEGRYVELVLADDGRVIEEIQVDAKHLTRRRFVYPDHD